MFMETGRDKLDMLKKIKMATQAGSADIIKSNQSKQRSDKMTLEIFCAKKMLHEIANNFESKLPWGEN